MDDEAVRLHVYREFVELGRAPAMEEIAAAFGSTTEQVGQTLTRLLAERHLVLDRDGENIVMAHPFSSVPLGFSVMGSNTLWWGGCAWDSFAMPHVLPDEDEVLVATTCPACRSAHAWRVTTEEPPEGDQVVHFLMSTERIWDDVVDTCRHQRIFCSRDCVNTWLRRTDNAEGYVADLPTLWRLAAHWYDGRLDRGYVRREPEAAKSYFAEVGLEGPFWGL